MPIVFSAKVTVQPINSPIETSYLQINTSGIEYYADITKQRLNNNTWNITIFLKEPIRNDIYACYKNLTNTYDFDSNNNLIYYNCSLDNFKAKWIPQYNINNNILSQYIINSTKVPIQKNGITTTQNFSYFLPFSFTMQIDDAQTIYKIGFLSAYLYIPVNYLIQSYSYAFTETTTLPTGSSTVCTTCTQWINISDNKYFNVSGTASNDAMFYSRFYIPYKQINYIDIIVEGQQSATDTTCGLVTQNTTTASNRWYILNITSCSASTDVNITYRFRDISNTTIIAPTDYLFSVGMYTNGTSASDLKIDYIAITVDYNDTEPAKLNSFNHGYTFNNSNGVDVNLTHNVTSSTTPTPTYPTTGLNGTRAVNFTNANNGSSIRSITATGNIQIFNPVDMLYNWTISADVFYDPLNSTYNTNNGHILSGVFGAASSVNPYYKYGWVARNTTSGNLTIWLEHNITGRNITYFTTNYSLQNRTWTTITWLKRNDYVEIYASGNLVLNQSVNQPIMPICPTCGTSCSPMMIGGYCNTSSTVTFPFSGMVDNLYTWTSALSPSQILILNTTKQFPFTEPNPSPPTISNIQNISITNESATITWTTDVASNTSVFYGTTTSLGSVSNTVDSVTSHSQPLSNLLNNTLYYYNVSSCSASGCTNSTQYSFWTLNTTAVSDSCTYSGTGTWIIQISDNCNISSQVNLNRNNIILNGSTTNQYRLYIIGSSKIINYSNVSFVGQNNTVWGQIG